MHYLLLPLSWKLYFSVGSSHQNRFLLHTFPCFLCGDITCTLLEWHLGGESGRMWLEKKAVFNIGLNKVYVLRSREKGHSHVVLKCSVYKCDAVVVLWRSTNMILPAEKLSLRVSRHGLQVHNHFSTPHSRV